MKLINHIRMWNHWRKRCLNGPVHKVLVLFGLAVDRKEDLGYDEEDSDD